MGRWRPPQEHSTAIITRAGQQKLKDELHELAKIRRPEVVAALSAAAAEGDRSENAEYIYRKKQLAEIDRRLRYLAKRIPQLRVADGAPTDRSAIFFGAWFRIETSDGRELTLSHRRPRRDRCVERPHQRRFPARARGVEEARRRRVRSAELPGGACQFTVLAVSYEGPLA
jgi:transcription elongation factor GreB